MWGGLGEDAASSMEAWGRTHGPRWPCTHAVVIHLLERLVADGSLKDDTLECVGLVTGHQLNADHLSFPHCHVTEHLRARTKRWRCQTSVPPPKPHPDLAEGEGTNHRVWSNL